MSRKQLFIISFGITLILIIIGFMIKVLYKNEPKQSEVYQSRQETTELTEVKEAVKKQEIPQDSSLYSILPEEEPKIWPTDTGIPEPNDVKIDIITSDETTTAVTFEADIGIAKSHLQSIKNQGYRTTYQVITGENIAYEGIKDDKIVNLAFYETGVATTTVKIRPIEVVDLAPVERPDNPEHPVGHNSIGTQRKAWPTARANGLPELKGKITNVDNTINSVIITLENVNINDMGNYIELVKSSGYTRDAEMESTPHMLIYKGATPINTFISIYYESTGTAILEIGQN